MAEWLTSEREESKYNLIRALHKAHILSHHRASNELTCMVCSLRNECSTALLLLGTDKAALVSPSCRKAVISNLKFEDLDSLPDPRLLSSTRQERSDCWCWGQSSRRGPTRAFIPGTVHDRTSWSFEFNRCLARSITTNWSSLGYQECQVT